MGPFEFIDTPIEGCMEIMPRLFEDDRGRFVKLFHHDSFARQGLNTVYEEQYYSVSSQRVLRGLHFQIPPNAHVKLVSCLTGAILDIVVDLRKGSRAYGQVHSLELSAKKGNMLYVPEGLAHGFYVLTDNCLFLSMNSKKYSSDCDSALRWNSIDFSWPDADPVISDKDKFAIPFNSFISPF